MINISIRSFLLPCALLLQASCALGPTDAAKELDAALARTLERGVHGAVMAVDAPGLGLTGAWAHGVAEQSTGRAMTVETPFLSASVGKLVVAAAVHRAVAAGCLSLDDRLGRFDDVTALAGLPVRGGDAALATITVAQLLGHRSGFPDYFSDPSADGAPRLFDVIATERDRTFTRDQLFDYARAHYAPVGAPAQHFHYADTNYDVLGVVLEWIAPTCAAFGSAGQAMQFHEIVRALVLDPLSMTSTWYHAFEPAPAGVVGVADVFVDGVNLWGAASLSADQAGGGLVTTVGDLTRLIRGLAAGNPVPLRELTRDLSPDAMHAGIDVGRGAWHIRPDGVTLLLTGMPTLAGHSGATGVWAYYADELDAVFVGALSDSAWQERHVEFLLADVLTVVARTKPQ